MKIEYNMDIEEYHAHPAISNSGLSLFAKAPRCYQYEKYERSAEERDKDKHHFVMGSALHTLLLEKELFNRRFFIWSGKPRNTKEGKADYAAAEEQAAGRVLLAQKDFDAILAMTQAIVNDRAALKYIEKPGVVEPSIIWRDPVNEVDCRCRPDLVLTDDHTLIDIKTAADASAEAFEKSIYNFGYDRQAYFYSKGYEAVTGNLVKKFVFIVVEKTPPYLVGVYPVDQVALMSGQIRVERLLEAYADCVKRDYWPGLNEGKEKEISIPSWAAYKMENETHEGVSA